MRAAGIGLIILILTLVSLSCGWTTLPDGSQSAPSAPALRSLDSGLEGLQSYRLALKLRFTGRSEGSELDQTVLIDTLEEKAVIGSQTVRHFLFLSSGASGLPGALEYYQVGDQGYTLSSAQGSDPTCQPAGSPAADPLLAGSAFELLPQLAVQSLGNAKRVAQAETVNGILSDHYRLEPTPSADGRNEVEGDLWIAQTGRYVVRFIGSMQGPVAINLLNGSGMLGWEYNLTDANNLGQLPVPEQCQALNNLSEMLPANAQNVLQSSTRLTFTSPSSAADLLAFFHAQLPAEDWSIDQEGGGGTHISLSASRGQQSVYITIGPETAGQTQVTIELGAEQ
jgi:hypothetical protein